MELKDYLPVWNKLTEKDKQALDKVNPKVWTKNY